MSWQELLTVVAIVAVSAALAFAVVAVAHAGAASPGGARAITVVR